MLTTVSFEQLKDKSDGGRVGVSSQSKAKIRNSKFESIEFDVQTLTTQATYTDRYLTRRKAPRNTH